MTDALIEELRAAYDARLRGVSTPGPGREVTCDGPLTRVTGGHRGLITGPRDLGLRGAALDELIARQREFWAARGEAVEWKTRGHDLPEDLPERLRAAGFVPEERETVVIGESAALAATTVRLGPELSIRQVGDRADLERVAALQSEVWQEDFGWLAEDLAGRIAAGPESIAVLAAEAGGRMVSAAWLVLDPGGDFGGLWGGSTLAAWRGRGVYRALIAHRARLAAERGVRHLYVDASEDSAPILGRLGLTAVTTTTPYVWTPGGRGPVPPGAGAVKGAGPG
ncbi:GNAT family N-acetyltransferase [Streptomyces physcomitrii]|uniref:GNAT family N-acetyltransferase n=1 Tax=Streptomyces physcomitrii TaxID=2724184 RepID=UPI0033D2AE89